MSAFRFDVWICVMQNITYEKKLWTDNLLSLIRRFPTERDMQSSSMFRIQLPDSTLSLISEAPHRKRYAVDIPYTVANFNAVSDIEGSPAKEICSLVYVPYTVMLSTSTLHTLISSQTPSTGLRHPSSARTQTRTLEKGAGKRCSECDIFSAC